MCVCVLYLCLCVNGWWWLIHSLIDLADFVRAMEWVMDAGMTYVGSEGLPASDGGPPGVTVDEGVGMGMGTSASSSASTSVSSSARVLTGVSGVQQVNSSLDV